MDPTQRVLQITQDVTIVMSSRHIPFHNDLNKKFSTDLQMSLGSFQGLLNLIQDKINTDPKLNLMHKLDWESLPGDPQSGDTFSQYYLSQSIRSLILGLDGVISHSPYVA
ncbi:MAG: hypothetical protein ACLP00_08540 [Terracidiphilus sp.]